MAAIMQSVRTAGQKYLSDDVTPFAATMVRYLFGLPFAVLWLVALAYGRHFVLPPLNQDFLGYGLLAGILQIVATVLLVRLFTLRHFAVGTTYARTEIMQTAILGFLFFGQAILPLGWVAIATCMAGVIVINIARSGGMSSIWNRAAAYGLAAGLAFSLTSLFLRHASRSLGTDEPVLTASMTLCYMVIWQTLITVGWTFIAQRDQFARVARLWRPSAFVGFTGVVGSAGWFTAMTLEFPSYVKTLGQVELLIALGIGWFYFHERPTRLEYGGMALIVVGVITLMLV